MAYVTAVGLDFDNGKFITYVQILNFAGLAKSDSTQVGKNIPVWVGKGEGITVTEAFNEIYATSQLRVFWGHVKAIVCTERYLKKTEKVKEAYDMINRYREIRYNVLLYGTKESINDIFVQKSILNMSPIDSLLDSPFQVYSQRSFITPHEGLRVISEINEAGQSAMLPSISIDKQAWTEDKNSKSMFRIDGAFYYSHEMLLGWMSEKELEGFRWLQEKLDRSFINIPDTNNPVASIVLVKPKSRIIPIIQDGNVYYTIKLNINAYVDEIIKDTSIQEMESMANQVVEDQIRKTFAVGLKKKIDVLQLGERLYRNYPKKWHELDKNSDFNLDANSLDKVLVKVNLQHTGKYKERAN